MKIEDISRSCRCCLSRDVQLQPLFGASYLAEMLCSLVTFEVRQGDEYPQQICYSCVRHLSTTYRFRNTVKTSQRTLAKLLKTSRKYEVNNKKATDIGKEILDVNTCCETDISSGSAIEGHSIENDKSNTVREGDDNHLHYNETAQDNEDFTHIEESAQTNIEVVEVSDLEENSMAIEKSKNIACSHCSQIFETDFEVMIHVMREHKIKIKTRPEQFRKPRANVNVQPTLVNRTEKPYLCSFCGKCFKWRTSLCSHVKLHTSKNLFECDVCFKVFVHKTTLALHMFMHTGEKPFKCSTCGSRFTQSSSLTKHKFLHTNPRIYKCAFCKKGFTQKGSLVTHLRKHTGSKPFECDICGKCFSWKNSLKAHLNSHIISKKKSNVYETGVKNKNVTLVFLCQLCDILFGTHEALKEHVKSHNTQLPKNSIKILPQQTLQLPNSSIQVLPHQLNTFKLLALQKPANDDVDVSERDNNTYTICLEQLIDNTVDGSM